jgi:hypothetical protein
MKKKDETYPIKINIENKDQLIGFFFSLLISYRLYEIKPETMNRMMRVAGYEPSN